MKEIIFDKKAFKSYKDMYNDICVKLDKDRFIDWRDGYKDLGYSADILNEFLWYCHDDSNKYIFINFDKMYSFSLALKTKTKPLPQHNTFLSSTSEVIIH